MRLIKEESISTDDVTIVTQYSRLKSRSEVSLKAPNHAYPIIASPMWHLGTPHMMAFFAKNNCPYVLHRYFESASAQFSMFQSAANSQRHESLTYKMWDNTFLAVGKDYEWIKYLVDEGIKNFCVDMAHGNSGYAEKSVMYIKSICPEAVIMAGNIETYDGYARLRDAGATYFRVGIASGSICSTNINTGNGLPILTALDNIYSKMSWDSKDNHFLIADGGMRTAGDIAKAIAFGASYVMCGKIFASTSHAAGPFYDGGYCELPDVYGVNGDMHYQGVAYESAVKYVQYAGMASKMMREKAGGTQSTAVSEEGKAGLIEYTGQTSDVFDGLMLNLKAVLSYSGCKTINKFREEVILQRISMGGKREKAIHLSKMF